MKKPVLMIMAIALTLAACASSGFRQDCLAPTGQGAALLPVLFLSPAVAPSFFFFTFKPNFIIN